MPETDKRKRKQEPGRKRGHRPAFEPTEDQRKMVLGMASIGVPQDNIATLVEIHRQTLAKYFGRELELGAARANFKVSNAFYKQACAGVAAPMLFWLKTKMGYRERDDVPGGGQSGNIEIDGFEVVDYDDDD